MEPQPPPEGLRTVHCMDALEWLGSQRVLRGCSFITSLPDVSDRDFGLRKE